MNSVVPRSYDPSVPARLAVLEEIAASTREILRDMRANRAEMWQAFRAELHAEMKDFRTDLRSMRDRQKSYHCTNRSAAP